MPTVHPTAVLEGDVQLADDVLVGPNCVLTGPVTIGHGTRLVGNVYVYGPVTLGANNTVYPFTCLGFSPQHAAFDPHEPGCGLAIGENNTFREHVTVHRAYTDDGPTTIGDRNTFMVASHVGHDARVGNDCTFVNGALLGGHVTIEDRVVVGGTTVVHQFCRVGRSAMLAGKMGTKWDIPPYVMLTGINIVGSLNMVGLRRSGMPADDIAEVKWVFRTLYREDRSLSEALETLREHDDHPIVAEYIQFLETSDRGLCPGIPKAAHGMVE